MGVVANLGGGMREGKWERYWTEEETGKRRICRSPYLTIEHCVLEIMGVRLHGPPLCTAHLHGPSLLPGSKLALSLSPCSLGMQPLAGQSVGSRRATQHAPWCWLGPARKANFSCPCLPTAGSCPSQQELPYAGICPAAQDISTAAAVS